MVQLDCALERKLVYSKKMRDKKDDKEIVGLARMIKEIGPRVDELSKQGFYIEAFLLSINITEFLLRCTIVRYEEWIERILKARGQMYKKTDFKDLERETFGQLIKRFKCYSKKEELVKKMDSLNSIRKKTVHHLTNTPIDQQNSLLKKKLPVCKDVIAELLLLNIEILNKKIRSSQRKIRAIEKSA